MGRTAAFDREAVVRAALGQFWRQGYEKTSVPDLESATGLGRSSIYNAFGSKRGLFDASVASYLDKVVRPRLAPLREDAVAPDAIIGYLTGLGDAITGGRTIAASSGCLLINAASAPIGGDPQVAAIITGYHADLRAAIGRGIDARLPRTSVAERTRLADAVTGLVVSAFALARVSPAAAGRSLSTARDLIERALASD